ncbi:hypothetical protein ASZ78_005487 [Callipepla squamata]|uniref:Uncharacterized protein n=1 Tax=Callipepla squamata TaxID=9009 RepID=A0A226NJC3_CALSU|nr:hypothetical protein ASZ78_005487 [Callipepla squamata]
MSVGFGRILTTCAWRSVSVSAAFVSATFTIAMSSDKPSECVSVPCLGKGFAWEPDMLLYSVPSLGQQSEEKIELSLPVNMITAFGLGSSEQSCAGNEYPVCPERMCHQITGNVSLTNQPGPVLKCQSWFYWLQVDDSAAQTVQAAKHGIGLVKVLFANMGNIFIKNLQSVQKVIISDKLCFKLYSNDISIDQDLKL